MFINLPAAMLGAAAAGKPKKTMVSLLEPAFHCQGRMGPHEIQPGVLRYLLRFEYMVRLATW